MKSRNYGLDLLRYVAMFFIVLEHTCNHWFGADIKYFESIGASLFLTFPLITGYFYNKKFSVYKLSMYYFELVFYSVIIAVIFGCYDLSYTSPLSKELWWYAGVYFLAMLFMPLFDKMPKKHITVLSLIGLFILLSIIPVLTYSSPFEVGDGMSFIFIFFIIYLGRFLSTIKDPSKLICVLGFILCIAITFFLNQTAYYNINSPYVIFASIFVFYIFKNMNFKSKISSRYAWPIYLIHCHPVVYSLFEGSTYGFSVGKCFIYALVIFTVCLIASIPFGILLNFIDRMVKKIPSINTKMEGSTE